MSEIKTTPQGTSEVNEGQGVAVVEQKETESQRMFKHLKGVNIPSVQALYSEQTKPATKPVEPVKEEAPKPEAKAEVKQEAKSESKKYLNIEDFKDSLVKLKVDGVEEEATFADIVRRVQMDQHITKKGQRVSEEEKQLRERERQLSEREKVAIEMLASLKTENTPDPVEDSIVKDDPKVMRLESELRETRNFLKSLQEEMNPFLLEQRIARASNRVKESLGMEDFKDYREKIRERLASLPPESARQLDNEEGWISTYKDIKLRELQEKISAKKEESRPMERPVPQIVPVESGKSASRNDIVDDFQAKKKSLFEKARRLTAENSRDKDQAWIEFMQFTKTGDAPE